MVKVSARLFGPDWQEFRYEVIRAAAGMEGSDSRASDGPSMIILDVGIFKLIKKIFS